MSDVTVLNLDENCDISQASHLLQTIRQAMGTDLQINAENVERIDASVIQLLISLSVTAAKHGRKVEVRNASEKFIRAARLSGADNILLGR